MIIGVVVGSIGAVMLSRTDVGTPTVEWVVSLVITGIGIGTGRQLPYTAVQVALEYVLESDEGFNVTFTNQRIFLVTNHNKYSCHAFLYSAWRVRIFKLAMTIQYLLGK